MYLMTFAYNLINKALRKNKAAVTQRLSMNKKVEGEIPELFNHVYITACISGSWKTCRNRRIGLSQ